ncbi:MAG: C25 family cysteine peptidase [Chitinophagales bacterium]
MKRILLILCCMCSFSGLFGQTYGNEWIRYDQKYLKFPITSNGIYRIDYTALSNGLALLGTDISDIDPRNIQIFNKGGEQYLFVQGEADGVFDPGDFIEFYGARNDGTFDARLYGSDTLQLQQYESIITDTAVYFLTWNNLLDNRRMSNPVNDLSLTPPAEHYMQYDAVVVYGSGYGSANFNPGPSYLEVHSSMYEDGEGFTSPKYNLSTVNVTVNTPNIYFGDAFEPSIRTAIIGANSSEHHVVFKVNTTTYADSTFFNYKVLRYQFTLGDLLPANTVTFVSGPVSTDYQRYSFIDIRYPRMFDFDNASKTRFVLPYAFAASRYMELTDFNEKGTDPLLYDLSAHIRMTGIVDADISKFHIPVSANGDTVYVSSQDISDIPFIPSLTPVYFTDYSAAANQGNYLIITHPSIRDADGVDWVQEYANYRSSVAGGSYQVRIVDMDQLYDAFSYGIRKHPLAIRNFILYAVDSFAIDPQYVFLMGKSYTYDVTRAPGTFEYTDDLIPTFGHPGSDNLLACRPGSVVPEVPIGRIVARSGDDVRIYLEKMIAYEAQQADMTQTVANKAWMKNVLHFAGGLTSYEQTLFNNFLNQYKADIEDTLYGGNVITFNKLNTDPIFYSESDYIDSLVNNGVSWITFFGHSSTGSFDFNIGEPEHFENTDKYFSVFGYGCNTAAIHGEDYTLGEKFIFAEDKGAIAFIAASNFSLASSLHTYATTLYRELSADQYSQSIGTILQKTNDSLWPSINVYDRMAMEHTTLQGDPALNMNHHPKPDYDIEEPYVFFEPELITASDDSFTVHIIVTNLGMAIDSSYYVRVKRSKPDGVFETLMKRVDATYFRDTVDFTFATDVLGGVGLNTFSIYVDDLNEVDEIDELNNILSIPYNIISNDAIPIYPVDNSILHHVPEYFAASTSDPFAPSRQYILQVDTSTTYNSPLFLETHVTYSGGVVYWQSPPVTWLPGKVYYWRIALDTLYDNDLLWRSASFLYTNDDVTGWNQSHYYQFLKDDFTNVELLDDRSFDFVPDVKTYSVATGIYPTTNWTEVTSYIDGELIAVGSCASTGFVVFVVDPNSGDPWTTSEVGTSNLGPYGDVYCSADPYERMIQFMTDTPGQRDILYHFMMDTIPDSAYFICYSNNYADFNEWLNDTLTYGHSLFDAFTAYGAEDILSLAVFDYDRSYIFYAQKGAPETKFELIGDEEGNKIEATFVIEGNWNAGSVESEKIGPAFHWDALQWELGTPDPEETDINSVSVFGVNYSGAETELVHGLQSGDTTLNFIDPDQYPYIRLKLNTKDDSLRTPAQLLSWKVLYDPVPEAAINPNVHFVYTGDSVQQGEQAKLEIAITNASDYPLDSVLLHFDVRDQNNMLHAIPYTRQDSLLSDSSFIAILTFQSAVLPAGSNTLILEINPDIDQPEQFHFNNLGYLPFVNVADIRDPLVDVTFDGVHIFDGDIVSAKPEIEISLRDENTHLALRDTSVLEVVCKYPDGSLHTFPLDGITAVFYPADTTELEEHNTARIVLHPEFLLDGTYELQVHGEDASGNDAGELDFRITFEVINKPMISNVFNYPNPFTTQTHFVFTLTGSEVPEYFKIQIMTISGKIVREIMRNELGPLHIGNNITEFTWDGTDMYGDRLANGLYLYRVVTRLNGKPLDAYDTGTDQYFTSGFGKMYLAR